MNEDSLPTTLSLDLPVSIVPRYSEDLFEIFKCNAFLILDPLRQIIKRKHSFRTNDCNIYMICN